MGVLFVCTGNICRSPTAEGVFRARVAAAGHAARLRIDSAGTHGYHVGEPPDRRSVAAARKRGYDLAPLRARRLAREDYAAFDYLIAMDRDHLDIMRRGAKGGERDRVHLFLDFAPQLGEDEVPDPYYGEGDGFEHVLDLVEAASDGLLAHIVATHFPLGSSR
ncbi:MAG: low molecular weight phosphotyrosine protein phosphatase [Alphaproteobacteria bacterium]|nr:low molecular weight phosphotyrosine protein phosphatase [Alphaproteobacteria bacterium]